MSAEEEPTVQSQPAAPTPDPAAAPATATAADDTPAPAAADTPSLPFPVVGIGASAGGLAAFEAFFSGLPADAPSGMAFVLVQHLAPDHKSLLAELVQRRTSMPVVEVENGIEPHPDTVYTIPPRHDLELTGGRLQLVPHGDSRRPHLTIDHFFTSLAAAQHERAIGVVLSGTGTDGSLGLRDIKGEGGLAIAQAPETAEFPGMPHSAIASGLVDYVLAPRDMLARLRAYVERALRSPAEKASSSDAFLKRVCTQLRAQTGHDFSLYKETTLMRRIERRMALRQIGRQQDYLRLVRENPAEIEALFHDLLIGVTSFFRDADAFEALQAKVLPRLLSAKMSHEPVRAWVCGCSTGEEAYSIAMLLHEYLHRRKLASKIQVFASDINPQAIEVARSGIYPTSIAAHVSEERLDRFFLHDAQRGTYRVQQHIRDMLVFSEQDVIRDPPFSKMDLVSCRNLLIYVNPDLQRRLIPLFHYALVPGGALFLGTSETVGESARLFEAIDRKWKLYVRTGGERRLTRSLLPESLPAIVPRELTLDAGNVAAIAGDGEPGRLRPLAEKALLAHTGHAGVLVNHKGQILHIIGRTGRYLEPADGDAQMNVLAMAREGLKHDLMIALHKSAASQDVVHHEGLRVRSNGHTTLTALTVRPVHAPGAGTLYLVVLAELPEPLTNDEGATSVSTARIAELERELRTREEYLQTTLEEVESTNEELKSTNEEMQSINEELQSTNEELETSKEELQSVNEELSTVNAELQSRVLELSRANNDMNNLLAGTGVGTVFIDRKLNIARFTPAAIPVINLIEGDIGRPFAHVSTNLIDQAHPADDVSVVLRTLQPREIEAQVQGGAWYLLRIHPYRTTDHMIEGVVITMIDISDRRRTEAALRESQGRLEAFINQGGAGVAETDFQGHFLFVNDRLCSLLGYSRSELMKSSMSEVTPPEELPELRMRLAVLAGGGDEVRIDRAYVRKDGTRVRAHERLTAIRNAQGQPTSLLSTWLDMGVAGPPEG